MQGWRRTFEDAEIFQPSVRGATSAKNVGVFGVLDGHGGSLAATAGAAILSDVLLELGVAGSWPEKDGPCYLQEAFFRTDAVLRKQMPIDNRSGSTVVLAVVTRTANSGFSVHVAHCGDSRAVISRGRALVCSEDHKPSCPEETVRIRNAGGSVERGALGGPMRVDGTLAVSRSLGDFHFKSALLLPSKTKVTAMPDVMTVQCSPGDWMLLACDGIFDVFENEEIREFVDSRLQHETPANPVDIGALTVDLLQRCLERGSKDNCTAILVRFVNSAETRRHERELCQGDWVQAKSEIRMKYAEFFESHGFRAEALAVQRAKAAPLSPGAKRQVPEPPAASSDSKNVYTLTKALQAMKGSRAIQKAWRMRKSTSSPSSTNVAPAEPSAGSSAGSNSAA